MGNLLPPALVETAEESGVPVMAVDMRLPAGGEKMGYLRRRMVRALLARLERISVRDAESLSRIIANGAGPRLMPGGRLLVEIGPTQGGAVAALFRAAGLEDIRILPDMDGRDRVVAARKPGDDSCGCA